MMPTELFLDCAAVASLKPILTMTVLLIVMTSVYLMQVKPFPVFVVAVFPKPIPMVMAFLIV